METYRVLLVDDEEEVRRAIAKKLDWAALGFSVVGEASNGEEALELLDTAQPDVIMTDIKMPFMDGLTLCRLAKKRLPGVKVAIFSGFDEFEYAKEAIKLEVEEYVLKPINAQELAQVFKRLYNTLQAEAAARSDIERLQRYYEASLPLMRQQFLQSLMEGSMGPYLMRQKMAEYDLALDAATYCVAVLHCARAEEEDGHSQLLFVSLQQLVREMVPAGLPYHLLQLLDKLVVLFLLPQGFGERDVIAALNQLFVPVRKFLGVQLSVGVGQCYAQLTQTARSYREANEALEYQILLERGQCIFIGDIEPAAAGAAAPDTNYSEEILRQIKIGTGDDLLRAVNAMVSYLKGSHINLQQYQLFQLEMATGLMRLIKAYRLDEENTHLGTELLEKNTHHFHNLDELGRWLYAFCNNLRHLIRRERKDSSRLIVDKAKEHLAQHYHESNLSLESVSGMLNVSPAYFSTLFKKETGLNFVGYLTGLRLEKALELLHTTHDKTYMIAEKTGYTDANYFSYVFKKQYGVSPSKYRQDRMGSGAVGKKAD